MNSTQRSQLPECYEIYETCKDFGLAPADECFPYLDLKFFDRMAVNHFIRRKGIEYQNMLNEQYKDIHDEQDLAQSDLNINWNNKGRG